MKIPVYSIAVPEYHFRGKPDSKSIGKKIDLLIKNHFDGKKVAIRCLGSQEHQGKSAGDIIKIIKNNQKSRNRQVQHKSKRRQV